MNIIYFLLPIALLLGFSFATAFAVSCWRGQFDDLETPAHRLLLDDEKSIDIKSDPKKGTTT
jgi:cbb3-type cytochrome oxidase maturation protein